MEIKRVGSLESIAGPLEVFTAPARIEHLNVPPEPCRVSIVNVSFEPGARTPWHTHPLGQTLIVTAGIGWVAVKGQPKQEVRAGDVVWIPPGENHWHGATATTAMTHIAVQEKLNGSEAEVFEAVGEADYRG